MDTTSITLDVDIAMLDLTTQPVELRSGPWICSVAIPPQLAHDMDLSISVACISQDIEHVDGYTQLRIVRARGAEPDSLVMLMPLRNPERLLSGIQVLVGNNKYNNNPFTSGRSELELHPPTFSTSSWASPRSCMSDCLSNSQVSMDARHRLEAFLDKAIHSDIQFSFCIPRSASPRSRSFGLDTSEHQSCPLPSSSLPSSLSMPLSSPPPTTSSPLSSPLPIGASRASRDNDMLYAHSCILKAAGTPSIERLVSTVVPGSDPEGSVREIRFEDSPPAAVEAVIRYIYLGQRPVLEPNCGYTVKDLMALASYLQIECLQDHCVDLVLGRSSEQSAAYKIKRGSNPSQGHGHYGGYHPYRTPARQPHERARHGQGVAPYSSSQGQGRWATRTGGRILKCGISAENAVQVLFGWGYKFPRMRRELIRAFVQDQGYGAWADEAAMLQRYRNHEGFGAIVEEMVGERYGWLEQ